jgi:hypothetical protein
LEEELAHEEEDACMTYAEENTYEEEDTYLTR